jgi:hypothetical protein
MTRASPVDAIRRWSDELIQVRRDLHAHPELGFEEHRTARLGQGGAEHGCFLRSSRYDFNDSVIALGAGYHASLAEHAMPATMPA